MGSSKSLPLLAIICLMAVIRCTAMVIFGMIGLAVVNAQQIGVHKSPLCVELVLEILCSSTKLTSALMLGAWCVFHVLDCVSFEFTLWVYVASRTQNGFKSVHREHKISWTHASTHLLVLWCVFGTTVIYYLSTINSLRPNDAYMRQ